MLAMDNKELVYATESLNIQLKGQADWHFVLSGFSYFILDLTSEKFTSQNHRLYYYQAIHSSSVVLLGQDQRGPTLYKYWHAFSYTPDITHTETWRPLWWAGAGKLFFQLDIRDESLSLQQRSVIWELGKLWHNPNRVGSQGLVTHQQIDIIAIMMIASRPQYRGDKNIVCPWQQ